MRFGSKRRVHLTLLLLFILGLFVFTPGNRVRADEPTAEETAAIDRVGRWKVINFAIFAVLLGWGIAKGAPKFFNARSADIRKAIEDATGLKLEADYRYSEIDRKMAGLAEEVKRLREQSQVEMDREHERFRAEARAEMDHIRHNMLAEVDALRKEAAKRVRSHTAQLAIGLAERRLQDRFAKGEAEDQIHEFVRLVEQGKN